MNALGGYLLIARLWIAPGNFVLGGAPLVVGVLQFGHVGSTLKIATVS